jgi:hypothetical protein
VIISIKEKGEYPARFCGHGDRGVDSKGIKEARSQPGLLDDKAIRS